MVGVVKFGLDGLVWVGPGWFGLIGLGWVGLGWFGLGWVGLVCFGLVCFVSDNVRQVQWCLAFGSFVKANLYNLAFAYLMFMSFGLVWFTFCYHPCLVWLVGP
jgi:hypothetical protein